MQYQHFGWELSPYSAKTRWYLRLRNIPHTDQTASAAQMRFQLQKDVGRAIVPVLYTPSGEALQDSTIIIDRLEIDVKGNGLRPASPLHATIDRFLELVSDEYLPTVMMHFRWTTPSNRKFLQKDFAQSAFPWLPRWIGIWLVQPLMGKMEGYLPALGAAEASRVDLERQLHTILTALEECVSVSPYLQGDRPSVADLALGGQLYMAYRDPGTTSFFKAYPAVSRWMQQLLTSQLNSQSTYSALPSAELLELIRVLAGFSLPIFTSAVAKTDRAIQESGYGKIPRMVGKEALVFKETVTLRVVTSYQAWMVQNFLDRWVHCTQDDQALLEGPIGTDISELRLPSARLRLTNGKLFAEHRDSTTA